MFQMNQFGFTLDELGYSSSSFSEVVKYKAANVLTPMGKRNRRATQRE
jgi:hypothetical protein